MYHLQGVILILAVSYIRKRTRKLHSPTEFTLPLWMKGRVESERTEIRQETRKLTNISNKCISLVQQKQLAYVFWGGRENISQRDE